MSRRAPTSTFAARPGAAEAWIAAAEAPAPAPPQAPIYSARLTLDVTPALRGRIKVAAFQRGQTVADMLRDLLIQAFPDDVGGGS
jgi:hypothetical protein